MPESDQEHRDECGVEEEEEEEDESVELSPEREVIFKKSKTADRNRRRRRQRKLTRDQGRKHFTERIDTTHPKMRLGKEAPKNSRRRPCTPSTDIMSVDNEEMLRTPKCPKTKSTTDANKKRAIGRKLSTEPKNS